MDTNVEKILFCIDLCALYSLIQPNTNIFEVNFM